MSDNSLLPGEYNYDNVDPELEEIENAFNGIQEIRNELPSQTIGRKRGEYLDRMLTDDLFYEQTMKNTVRRRVRTKDKISAVEGSEALAADDFEKLKQGELRDLPFSMKMKRSLRNKWKMNSKINKNESTQTKQATKALKTYKNSISNSFELWAGDIRTIEGNFGSGVASYFLFLRGMFFLSIPSFFLSFCFISLPQLIDQPVKDNLTFTGEEIITGANWLSDTVMYYGHYVNGTISKNDRLFYNMPLAYLLATFFYFVVCLVWIFRETATNFRMSYVDSTLDAMNFTNKIFCSWSYSIMSKENADLLHKSIYFDLKEILAETKLSKLRKESKINWSLHTKRAFIWLIWACFTGGSIAFVYYLNGQILPSIKTGSSIFDQILLALFVSTVNFLMPFIIFFLTTFEDYNNPRNELFVGVIRIFLLKIGMLATICVFWTDSITNEETRNECWETRLGEEVYRLVVFDLMFCVVFNTFCMEFIRKVLSDVFSVGNRPIFAISINVLDLIYGQTLCWVGIFFSPILSLIVIIKYVLLFYIKKTSVLRNCRPSKRRWRASQSRTFFNSLLLLCFISSFSFIVYVVYSVRPSEDCGPFRDVENSYSIITQAFNSMNLPWLRDILQIIVSVWFLYGFVILLSIYTVFLRSRGKAKEKLTERLKEQIYLQGQDKALLLTWLKNISQNHKQFTKNMVDRNSGVHRQGQIDHSDMYDSAFNSRASAGLNAEQVSGFQQLTHVDPQHAIYNAGNNDKFMGRKEHKDPLYQRAFRNQVTPENNTGYYDENEYGEPSRNYNSNNQYRKNRY